MGLVGKSHTNKTGQSIILQVASSVKKQAPLSQMRPDPKVKITTNFPYLFLFLFSRKANQFTSQNLFKTHFEYLIYMYMVYCFSQFWLIFLIVILNFRPERKRRRRLQKRRMEGKRAWSAMVINAQSKGPIDEQKLGIHFTLYQNLWTFLQR